MFNKILIANRGEIAVRIIRACKEMGIATVTVFSEADREALHVHMSDESYCIGPAQVGDSYLNMEAILTVAVQTKSEAIHPGYGLLSENAKFAELCETCHVVFIGPSSDIISKMGDKDVARRTMIEAGVPVIPGTDIQPDVASAQKEANKIGYPLLIKARSGGGGRGIRKVETEEGFAHAYETASAESLSAFGDGAVYLEKFVSPARHIEIQIIADKFGNCVALGERDCSIQRRNQKLLEESPSPALSAEKRAQMMATAVAAAKAVNYVNAGTIEFLYDSNGNYYFMEMNTRLQVEHPVTEMVTNVDLVQWQIRVAAGVELGFTQDDIKMKGHAIECRINAENPYQNFRPSCGVISLLHVPGGPEVRFDSAIYQGYFIPPFYDSMIGKLIVHARTRAEAIRKIQAALSELVVEGIEHNSELQLDITSDEAFISGDYNTSFIQERQS